MIVKLVNMENKGKMSIKELLILILMFTAWAIMSTLDYQAMMLIK